IEEERLRDRALEFEKKYDIRPTDLADSLKPDQMETASLRESCLAHRMLFFRAQNLSMMNYSHHLNRADAERNATTIEARKLVYEADQFRIAAELERAIETYLKGFDKWKAIFGNEAYREFRNDDTTQTETYEAQLRYQEVLAELRGGQLRPAL